MTHYISLGSDCSVSYQLRKTNLQIDGKEPIDSPTTFPFNYNIIHGTMPFDWMKITNLDKLCAILDNDFANFADFSKYEVKEIKEVKEDNEQSTVFDFIDNRESEKQIKSLAKLTHREYGFTLPHEYKYDKINILEFEQKYSRRIERFRQVVRNPDIQKIFVRLGNSKEQKKIEKQINNNSYLENTLSRYGCKNYKVKFINMDDYAQLIPKEEKFDWHRDYIDWGEIFLD
jgi:hypothetical protein